MNWQVLFILLCAHALADFPLQGQYLAVGKFRENSHWEGRPHWLFCLTYHALIHGIVVAVLLSQINYYPFHYGVLAAVVHWFIDFARGEKLFGINWDQFIHIVSVFCMWALIGVRV